MSLLARLPAKAAVRQIALRRTPASSRFLTPEQSVPFSYKNKTLFGAKVAGYLLTGFAIPFIASVYQLSKSS
ncbi:cytochrome c oxidase subunit VIIc [Phanerochaete sordida]|uniref:Cytochrome c oxidase subunit 8, mitochondrial n=1 Tax=Phanerochaete sordida TaxID=48140 RepID=A0A9P3FX32_9APHY|nr:cytochrome c oxidase subunit VIIc [Phanerochaete sordida]